MGKAEQSYKQAIVLEPNSADTHYKLGITLQALKELQEAEESYRQATTLTTGFLEAHEKLAYTQRKLGKIAQAVQSERYVRLLNPSNIEDLSPDKCPDDLAFKQPSPIEYPALYRAGMGTENVSGFLETMAQMLRVQKMS